MPLCSSTTSGTSGPQDKWVQQAAKDAYGRVNDFSKTPFTPFTGQQVAPLSGNQKTALSSLRSYATGGAPDVYGAVTSGLNAYGAAPASSVSTESVIDPSGRLGPMSGYIDPNIDATLTPTIRNINEQATTQRQQLGGQAAGAHAFGDARHGVLEGMINRNADTAVGDATGQAYSTAWNNAMSERSGDLSRFLTADTTNAGLNEQALQRKYQAATGLQGEATAAQAQKLGLLQALLTGGGIQQQTKQNQDDARYRTYQAKQQNPFDKLGFLVSGLQGLPFNRQTTSTTPDNSLLSILGGVAGAATGGMA